MTRPSDTALTEQIAELLMQHQPFTDGAFTCEWCHTAGLSSTDAEDAAHVAAEIAALAGAGAQVTEAADPGCVQWQYGACTCEHECPDDRPHMAEADLRARISALADRWTEDHDDADDCETCWLIQDLRKALDRPAAAEGNET